MKQKTDVKRVKDLKELKDKEIILSIKCNGYYLVCFYK